MKKLFRSDVKAVFKKVKTLKVPDDIEEIEFDNLHYYSWRDPTNEIFLTVTYISNKLEGIAWKIYKLPQKPLALYYCDICHKTRSRHDIISISTPTKKLPKNLTYRSKSFHMCADYKMCNESLKDSEVILNLFDQILFKE